MTMGDYVTAAPRCTAGAWGTSAGAETVAVGEPAVSGVRRHDVLGERHAARVALLHRSEGDVLVRRMPTER